MGFGRESEGFSPLCYVGTSCNTVHRLYILTLEQSSSSLHCLKSSGTQFLNVNIMNCWHKNHCCTCPRVPKMQTIRERPQRLWSATVEQLENQGHVWQLCTKNRNIKFSFSMLYFSLSEEPSESECIQLWSLVAFLTFLSFLELNIEQNIDFPQGKNKVNLNVKVNLNLTVLSQLPYLVQIFRLWIWTYCAGVKPPLDHYADKRASL